MERRGVDSADKRNDLSGGVTFLPGLGELLPLLSGSVGGKNTWKNPLTAVLNSWNHVEFGGERPGNGSITAFRVRGEHSV